MTQEDLDILKQQNRELSVVIKLMNKDMQFLDEISGEVISYDFSIDSTSDIRRTCSLSLYPNGTYDIANNGNIWFNRYVNINVGVKNNSTKEIVYYNMGTYLLDEPSYEYSGDTNTLSIKCLDLMCVLTELRGGVLQGFGGKISSTDSVRQWIIDLLALKGFTDYNIIGITNTETLPTGEDLTFDVGATVYRVLSAIIDLYPNYQMFFDIDSVFNFIPIPTGDNEQIIASQEVWDNTLISISNSPVFSDVKNSVEVFGKTHDITYYCANPIISGGTGYDLSCEISGLDTYIEGTMIGITIPSDYDHSQVNFYLIGENNSIPITIDNIGYPTPNFAHLQGSYSTYIVLLIEHSTVTPTDFVARYIGSKQPYSLLQITNTAHPFSISNIGTVHKVCTGGIYDNITSDSLALDRAKWELYTSGLLQASLGLSCVPIYWLDVNKVIEVPIIDENGTTSLVKCIIKNISISGGVTGTMSITAMKYYPYYYS